MGDLTRSGGSSIRDLSETRRHHTDATLDVDFQAWTSGIYSQDHRASWEGGGAFAGGLCPRELRRTGQAAGNPRGTGQGPPAHHGNCGSLTDRHPRMAAAVSHPIIAVLVLRWQKPLGLQSQNCKPGTLGSRTWILPRM
ncbi:hypothetical protein Nmel_017958 [Mimus melanotis]